MSWSKFHFDCRFLAQKLCENVSGDKAEALLSKNYAKIYTNNLNNKGSFEDDLYQKIIAEPNLEKRQTLLSTYGKLNLTWDLSSVSRLANIRNYLFLLSCMFLLISAIYKFFVLPKFIDIFDQMNLPISSNLQNFNGIWAALLILMLLSCLALLQFSSFVKGIGQKESHLNTSMLRTSFVPKVLIEKSKLIDALIYAPLGINLNEYSAEQIAFSNNLIVDNLDLATELQIKINEHRAALLNIVNTHSKKLMAVFSITVISAISYLLFSFYQPIFSLGQIV